MKPNKCPLKDKPPAISNWGFFLVGAAELEPGAKA